MRSTQRPDAARDATDAFAGADRDPFHSPVPLVTLILDLPRPRVAARAPVRFSRVDPADVLSSKFTRVGSIQVRW
jgi:hypothetical protein